MSHINIPTYDDILSVTDEALCQTQCLHIVQKIKPQWNTQEMTFKFFTGGITNRIFSVCPQNVDSNNRLVFRVYGENTDLVVDRDRELETWHRLAAVGAAASLYGRFFNGIVCGYQPGNVLNVDNVKNKEMFPKVAAAVARMHRIIRIDETTSRVWEMLEKFMKTVPDIWQHAEKHGKSMNNFYTPTQLRTEITHIKSVVDSIKDAKIVFCHNDLLMENILYDEDNDKINLIDYEYAMPNYQAFDIANHFNEYSGTDNIGVSQFPDKSYQRKWVIVYLKVFNNLEPSKENIETLLDHIAIFAPIAHFVWAMWAMVQTVHSSIDFDYFQYGMDRMKLYKLWRHDIK